MPRAHPVGFRGQKYRCVVDEEQPDGSVRVKVIFWTDRTNVDCKALETNPLWSNARLDDVQPDEPSGYPTNPIIKPAPDPVGAL